MKKNETNIQIDKLKLCFWVPAPELNYLQENTPVLFIGNYKIKPVKDDRFDYCFDVFETNPGKLLFDIDEIGDWCDWGLDEKQPELPIGQIKFSNTIDRNMDYYYLIFHIYNHILYSDKLAEIVQMPFLLADNIKFNNFTSLDIALDSQQNIPSLINKMRLNKDLTAIINRKAVNDRNKVITEGLVEYSLTMNKLKYPTFTFRQKKAYKDEGVEVQAYNKRAEIENSSGKYYILKHYDKPKRLYRFEVRLPYRAIKDYHNNKGIEQDLNLIFDKQRLLEMFLFFLDAVIHFKDKSRRKIQWKELLKLSPGGI